MTTNENNLEIERKFLVCNPSWRGQTRFCVDIRQGYLARSDESVVRVRTFGDKAFLTIKIKKSMLSRQEFEYEIPKADANELLNKCQGNLIQKKRYFIDYESKEWTIDEFFGHRNGLVLAEIELKSEQEIFKMPPWAGNEVTDDPRYLNSNL